MSGNYITPYGEILGGGQVSRYTYESKEYDPVTKTLDFGFRQIDPNIPFWQKPDTEIPNVYDSQSLNRYMFERANPYKYTDPDGHFLWVPLAVGGAIGLIDAGIHLYNNPGDYKGAAIHGSITAATVTASLYAPVTAAGGTALRVASHAGLKLFGIGATGSLAHSAVDGRDFTSGGVYIQAGASGFLNSLGGPLLRRLGVPGLTNYKPGQYFPSSSFSQGMYNELVSSGIITGTSYTIDRVIISDYVNYQSYFSQEADESKSSSKGSRGRGGGGGGGCRCGPWGDLREEAENAAPGETAGDIIRRWRENQ